MDDWLIVLFLQFFPGCLHLDLRQTIEVTVR